MRARACAGGATGVAALSTRIPRLRLEYQIARPIFVRVVSQYESGSAGALRDPRSGGAAAGARAEERTSPSCVAAVERAAHRLALLVSPAPGTVFFAGYGNTLTEPEPLAFDDLRRTSDGFFVKASWVFQRNSVK